VRDQLVLHAWRCRTPAAARRPPNRSLQGWRLLRGLPSRRRGHAALGWGKRVGRGPVVRRLVAPRGSGRAGPDLVLWRTTPLAGRQELVPTARWSGPDAGPRSMKDQRPRAGKPLPRPRTLSRGRRPAEMLPATPWGSDRRLAPGRSRRPQTGRTGPTVAPRPSAPGQASCPCATGRSPVGQTPRLGRVETLLNPARLRYRGTATPETDPPATSHRPVLVSGWHRARPSRLRVTLPRCRPSPWCLPAATPTSPMSPARVPLVLPGARPLAGAVAPVRPTVGSGIRPSALLGPAVLHRVVE
jgi:hypothetical protein